MSKSTNNWKAVTAFIKSASVEGLERVMVDVRTRMESTDFTPEQQNAFDSIIDKDNVDKAAAKLTAAQTSGLPADYDTTIGSVVATANFADVKRYVHAIDTRLKSLPLDQKNECIFTVQSTPPSGEDGLGDLSAILGGLDLPPEGAYMDDDGDGSYDNDADLL